MYSELYIYKIKSQLKMDKFGLNCKLLIIITSLLLTQTSFLKAQVTIGSGLEPNKGALLDLKEEGIKIPGTNATKGLGMPRVYLPKLNELTMGEPGKPQTKVATENWVDHTGLIVYNINEDYCPYTPIQTGIYVWDGNQWQFLGENLKDDSSILKFTDKRDGEEYRFRAFGNPNSADFAGYWMLENLRYDPILNEDRKNGFNKEDFIHSASKPSSIYSKHFVYPEGNESNYIPSNHPSVNWDKRNGILYNRAAATNNENHSGTNEQQLSDGTDPTLQIRGICPEGWHLPSDKEWNDLEREIMKHASKYSSNIPDNPAWNNDWETSTQYRGTHANAMKSKCPPINSTDSTKGQSLMPFQGGFNALLVGNANENSVANYGVSTYFWTSSSYHSGGYIRGLRAIYEGVYRSGSVNSYLSSVRCKKDD